MRDKDIIGKTKRVQFDYFEENPEEQYPSRFYVRDCMGDWLFFLVRDEKTAREMMQHLYGKKYQLRITHPTKNDKPKTAVGVATRKGQKK